LILISFDYQLFRIQAGSEKKSKKNDLVAAGVLGGESGDVVEVGGENKGHKMRVINGG
jgi:hypothetical protein